MKHLFFFPFLFIACSHEGAPDGTHGTLTLLMKSRALNSESSLQQIKTANSIQCQVQVDGTPVQGRCSTPVSVSGFFNEASLEGTSAPARLLGGGSMEGVKGIFQHAFFDLLTSPTISGEDNLQDQGGPFTRLNLKLQMLETTFRGTPQFARTFFVRQFFVHSTPSQDPALSGCLDAPSLEAADTYGTLVDGLSAQAGDLMVCVGTAATACVDYHWIDSTTGSQTSTRPENPLQVRGALLGKSTTCSVQNEHPDATWGYGTLTASIPNVLQAEARIDKGQKLYTIQGVTGSHLQLEIDLDADQALFMPSSLGFTDLSAMTEAEILEHLNQILLKPIFVGNAKTTAAPGDEGSMLSATITTSIR